MGNLDFGNDPPDPEPLHRESGEERRGNTERMEGGADIVAEAGQGQFLGTGSAAERLAGFEYHDAVSVLGHHHSCRETVGSRPDNYGVVRGHPQWAVPPLLSEGSAIPDADRRSRYPRTPATIEPVKIPILDKSTVVLSL